MGDIEIKADAFFERLNSLYTTWKSDKRSPDGAFSGADSFFVVTGKASEQESAYQKNNALHFWLLGYEFPATLMVFTQATAYVVTTEKKGEQCLFKD